MGYRGCRFTLHDLRRQPAGRPKTPAVPHAHSASHMGFSQPEVNPSQAAGIWTHVAHAAPPSARIAARRAAQNAAVAMLYRVCGLRSQERNHGERRRKAVKGGERW